MNNPYKYRAICEFIPVDDRYICKIIDSNILEFIGEDMQILLKWLEPDCYKELYNIINCNGFTHIHNAKYDILKHTYYYIIKWERR